MKASISSSFLMLLSWKRMQVSEANLLCLEIERFLVTKLGSMIMAYHNLLTHLNGIKVLGGSLDRIGATISSNISLNVVISPLLSPRSLSLFYLHICTYFLINRLSSSCSKTMSRIDLSLFPVLYLGQKIIKQKQKKTRS